MKTVLASLNSFRASKIKGEICAFEDVYRYNRQEQSYSCIQIASFSMLAEILRLVSNRAQCEIRSPFNNDKTSHIEIKFYILNKYKTYLQPARGLTWEDKALSGKHSRLDLQTIKSARFVYIRHNTLTNNNEF